MKIETVAHGNGLFLIINVGMCLGMRSFAHEILESIREQIAQYPTDSCGAPGYIKVDISAIKEKGYGCDEQFETDVENGLFVKVSYGFSSRTEFEGELNEKVIIKKDNYEFLFHIKEYERDSANGFEIITPDKLIGVPEDEKLGRVVYLIIRPLD
ncbi:hypothetical protein C0584_03010 [Candidatus Parcubacteria bacterium]|mgnify:CR=1 FL=1|nr:MAG: hypothetical protein C0584_03010 [Candidatus Parcubacteria bacterium]